MPSGLSCHGCCRVREWRDGPGSDDRVVLNGIVWKLRTGSAWRDVPERYGSWQTLYTRFRRWALDGTFTRMLKATQAEKDAAGDIDWLVPVDSTIVRAHQHAEGGKRGRSTATKRVITPSGRSRGGLSTKVHLACDGRGRPLGFVLAGGNTNDCTRFEHVMDAIHVPRTGPGRQHGHADPAPRVPEPPGGRSRGPRRGRHQRAAPADPGGAGGRRRPVGRPRPGAPRGAVSPSPPSRESARRTAA